MFIALILLRYLDNFSLKLQILFQWNSFIFFKWRKLGIFFIITSGGAKKVNSESDFEWNLVKNQPSKFTPQIVEQVYNQLSFEEKYKLWYECDNPHLQMY